MTKGKKIALTGGIGSGKSTAMNALRDSGYKTLSSDEIVKDLYEKHSVKAILKELFPSAISGKERLRVNRKKLSEQAFSCQENHSRLTDAITPLVLDEILRRLKNYKGVSFVEVPLLFECGYEKFFDGVIVILRKADDRINSVKERSNLSEEEIKARMEKQVDYDTIDFSCYHVIENDGDKDLLKEKILSLAKTF